MVTPRWIPIAVAAVFLLAGACRKKPVQTQTPPPPAPKQNIFALLPEPDGKSSGIVVSNSAGRQELNQPNQAVRVERVDVAPSAPFTLDQAAVRRLFGAALDVLPAPEVQFVLYFEENSGNLNAQSLEQLPAILAMIQERHSTAVTIVGHTDSTADAQYNYRLGLVRAQRVEAYLRDQGVDASNMFVDSHGEADQLVKTPHGQPEPRNRRVEVIVR